MIMLAGAVPVRADVIVYRSESTDRATTLRVPGTSTKVAQKAAISAVDARAIADAFLAEHGAVAGLTDAAGQLAHVETRQDELGLSHVIYHQYHRGLPVRNASVRVHLNQTGDVYLATLKVVTDLPFDVVARAPADQARETAEDAARDLLPQFADIAAEIETPELVLLPLGLSRNEAADDTRLAWETHVTFPKCADGECPTFGAHVAIDAKSGSVLYTLRDWEGLDRRVYDCSKDVGDVNCYIDSPGISGYVHGRSEGMPVRGPHNNPALPQFGSTDVDYMYDIASTMHGFVQTSFGINGANNQGGARNVPQEEHQSRYYVHSEGWNGLLDPYCPGGAWNSSTNSIVLCNGEIYDDVLAHEYGHSIVDWSFTSGGVALGTNSSNPHTRALEESHSDIVGEAFEFNQTGALDWMAGGAVVDGPWRDLIAPHDFIDEHGFRYAQRFYDQYFDCDQGVGSGGFYSNSTVYSHAMYLASEGGEMNGCEITGQGIDFVTQVYHRAWRVYFSSSQNFDTADDRLLQACSDLYDSTACGELAKALQAVEADQLGICDDPQGAAGESAPACAVAHGGTAQTTQADATPSASFQAGEPVWLALASGTPNRTVDFVLAPHDSARPIWDDLDAQALDTSSGTLDSTGALTAYFFTPTTEDTFDVIVDGNQDGDYQPWADETMTIIVSGFATDVPEGAVPSARVLVSVRPNPFNPTTNFSLRLRETSRLRLTIYDTAGRAVRTLARESALAPGDYDFTWDGTGDSGAPVASGLYLYRIETARGSEFGKITLVK